MTESKVKLIKECGEEMKFELNPKWWEDVTSIDTWGKKVTRERDSDAQSPKSSWLIWGTKRMPVGEMDHGVGSRDSYD